MGGKFLDIFKRLVLALHLDFAALLKEAGIDHCDLEDPGLTLPARAIEELIESAGLSSGIGDFGLRLGEVYGVPDLGPAGLLMREERTVRDALQTLIALRHLHSDPDLSFAHLEDGDTPIFMIVRKDPGLFRQANDFLLALNVHILRSLLGEDWAPVSVCFAHARPRPSTRLERFFRCPVHFDQELNGIVLRRGDLDTKMPPASSVLHWQMDLFIQTIDIVPGNASVHRAARIVAMALPRGQAKAKIIARCLGIDRRTLNRHLSQAGLNYSTLVASVRKNLAAQHLLGSDRRLVEIADILGFSSLSTFTRWFHRSFGCAPRAWRQARKSAPSRHQPVVPKSKIYVPSGKVR